MGITRPVHVCDGYTRDSHGLGITTLIWILVAFFLFLPLFVRRYIASVRKQLDFEFAFCLRLFSDAAWNILYEYVKREMTNTPGGPHIEIGTWRRTLGQEANEGS